MVKQMSELPQSRRQAMQRTLHVKGPAQKVPSPCFRLACEQAHLRPNAPFRSNIFQ